MSHFPIGSGPNRDKEIEDGFWDGFFRSEILNREREIKNDKNLMYKCTKNTITWQILNLVTFWSGFWSTGWDKWSLMGHPVTKSSPYGSDVKTCTWLKSVCWSRLSGSTPFSYRPRGPDGFCHTSTWVMGRTVLSDRRPWANICLFLYRQNDSQF